MATVSLLHFDGNLTDTSGKIWTPNGGLAASTAQIKFGSGSAYFNGSQYLSTPDSSYFNFGTNNFTIDYWIFQTARGTYDVSFSFGSNSGYNIYTSVGTESGLCWLIGVGGTEWNIRIATGIIPSLNTWHHHAFIRYGNTFSLYLDGVSQGSATSVVSIGNYGYPVFLGSQNGSGSPAQYITGYIDEFHIDNTTALWTSNFTPPTHAYSPSIQQYPPGGILSYLPRSLERL